jgi:hypothetical protein
MTNYRTADSAQEPRMIRTSRYSRISLQLSPAEVGSDDDSVGLRRKAGLHSESPGSDGASPYLRRGLRAKPTDTPPSSIVLVIVLDLRSWPAKKKRENEDEHDWGAGSIPTLLR